LPVFPFLSFCKAGVANQSETKSHIIHMGTHKHHPISSSLKPGADPEGGEWVNRPPKTCESIFFHNEFVKFGKHHLRYKEILSSIIYPSSVVKYTSSLLQ